MARQGKSLAIFFCRHQRKIINKMCEYTRSIRRDRLRTYELEILPSRERCIARQQYGRYVISLRHLDHIAPVIAGIRFRKRTNGSEQKGPGQRADRNAWLRVIWNRANLTDGAKCGVEPRARKKYAGSHRAH